MSRSGYSDDIEDQWAAICYRGAVTSAIKGKRGQAFLKEMLTAIEALPEKKLIYGELEAGGEVCAIGSVGKARGIDMKGLDPEDIERVARVFGISTALAREIVYMNDEYWPFNETPEVRHARMCQWIKEHIRP